jgi:hypothetical protein
MFDSPQSIRRGTPSEEMSMLDYKIDELSTIELVKHMSRTYTPNISVHKFTRMDVLDTRSHLHKLRIEIYIAVNICTG